MKLPIAPSLAILAVAFATACGGSSSSSSETAATSTPASAGGGYGKPAATSTPAAGSEAVSIKASKGELGTFLTDSEGRTLYLWEADKSSSSTCSGACAQAWPPLTTKAAPKAGAGVQASLLGTTKRDDGTMEVTYDGHPLYYFAGDSSPGQTSGQGNDGFGAEWYVVAPNGKAIDED